MRTTTAVRRKLWLLSHYHKLDKAQWEWGLRPLLKKLNVRTFMHPIYMWRFKSASSSKVYETLKYDDGSVSCDCPGWTRRSARTCKHTRSVQLGDANRIAVNHGPLHVGSPYSQGPLHIGGKKEKEPHENNAFHRKFSD